MENKIESKKMNSIFNKGEFQMSDRFSVHPTSWYKIIEENSDGLQLKYFIDKFIFKVSLEELLQFSIACGYSSLYYIEINRKSYLFKYYFSSVSKILENGLFKVNYIISNITFAEIEQYRKLVIYNHAKLPHILYQNEMDSDINNGYRNILAVWHHQTHIRDIIIDILSEYEENKQANDKSLNYKKNLNNLEVQEVHYVDRQIKEVPFESLVEMVAANKLKSLRFLEINGKKYLVNYTTKSGSKKLKNGNYISKTIFFNVQYSEVKEYKRFIIYDHLAKEKCQYVNNLEQLIKKSSTYVVVVWNYQSMYLQILKNAIKEDINKKLIL